VDLDTRNCGDDAMESGYSCNEFVSVTIHRKMATYNSFR